MSIQRLFACLTFSIVAASAGLAAADDHPPPPPEAFTACDAKAAGDTCSVRFHDESLDGTCRPAPDARLACVPAKMPRPHGPPPEARQACESKNADDACSLTFHGDAIDGTCRTAHDGVLACFPTNPPPPPSR